MFMGYIILDSEVNFRQRGHQLLSVHYTLLLLHWCPIDYTVQEQNTF